MSTESFHFITHTHDRDAINVRFECTAPITADCNFFPDCDCEDVCEHLRVQQTECGYEAWMNDYCGQECFEGNKDEPVRGKAPITTGQRIRGHLSRQGRPHASIPQEADRPASSRRALARMKPDKTGPGNALDWTEYDRTVVLHRFAMDDGVDVRIGPVGWANED